MSTQHFTAVQPRGKKQQFAAWEHTAPEVQLRKPVSPRAERATSAFAHKAHVAAQAVYGGANDLTVMAYVKTDQAVRTTLSLWPNLSKLNKVASETKKKLKSNHKNPLSHEEILHLVRSATAGNELAAGYAPMGSALKVSVGSAAAGVAVLVVGVPVALGALIGLAAASSYKMAMFIAVARNKKQTLALYDLAQVKDSPALRAQMSAIESPNAGPAIEEQARTISKLAGDVEQQDITIAQMKKSDAAKDEKIAALAQQIADLKRQMSEPATAGPQAAKRADKPIPLPKKPRRAA